jgi:2,3-bisphosphoglycerate-dependent phosphoglycerate mutase
MFELWLIRHGETPFNKAGRMQGHLNVPLSEQGHQEAALVAARIAKLAEAGTHFDTLHCSDLLRCEETAAPISAALGLAITPEPLLREIDVGGFEGLDSDQIKAKYPEIAAAIRADYWHAKRPDGESMHDVLKRFEKFVTKLGPGRHIGVTHRGVIRGAMKLLLNLDTQVFERYPVGNTSITAVDLAEPIERRAILVGDSDHLIG